MKEGLLFLFTLMMIGCGAVAQTKGKLTISVSAGAAVPVFLTTTGLYPCSGKSQNRDF